VQEGSTNLDLGFVCTSNAGGTLGTTAITFQQFSGAGQITASGGLSKSGNTISVATAGITLAMQANIATASFMGRTTAGTGVQEALSMTTAKTMLGLGTAAYAATGDFATASHTQSVATGGTGATAVTGTGSNVLSTSPALVTPILGTPTSGNLSNCTFPTLNQNTTGSAGGLSAAIGSPVATTNTFTSFSTDTPGFYGGYDIRSSGFTSASLRFLSSAGAVETILTGGTSVMTVRGSAGTYTVALEAKAFSSSVAIGTIPFQCVSTTLCTNLNANYVGGIALAGLMQTGVTIDGGTF